MGDNNLPVQVLAKLECFQRSLRIPLGFVATTVNCLAATFQELCRCLITLFKDNCIQLRYARSTKMFCFIVRVAKTDLFYLITILRDGHGQARWRCNGLT